LAVVVSMLAVNLLKITRSSLFTGHVTGLSKLSKEKSASWLYISGISTPQRRYQTSRQVCNLCEY